MSDLTSKTLSELRGGFRAREFTAREIAESFNAAVAGAKALNAYTVATPDDAFAAAEAADSGKVTGSLAGIPLGIKDLFATHGVDTTAGSKILTGLPLSGAAAIRPPSCQFPPNRCAISRNWRASR